MLCGLSGLRLCLSLGMTSVLYSRGVSRAGNLMSFTVTCGDDGDDDGGSGDYGDGDNDGCDDDGGGDVDDSGVATASRFIILFFDDENHDDYYAS